MSDAPVGSETIPAPVEEFRKQRKKREAKRKEVKVIVAHTPEPVTKEPVVKEDPPVAHTPEPVTKEPVVKEDPPPPPPVVPDAESIAGRVAEILLAKIEQEEEKAEVKSRKAPKRMGPPPPTKSFGWC